MLEDPGNKKNNESPDITTDTVCRLPGIKILALQQRIIVILHHIRNTAEQIYQD